MAAYPALLIFSGISCSRLSAQWRLHRCRPVFRASCQPSGGIRLRSDGTPVRIPGNGPFDVCCTHRHKLRKFLRKPGKRQTRVHYRVTYTLQQGGRFVRSPCREQCSAPLVSDLALGDRMPRNGHMLRRSHYTLQCRIGTVDEPWSSPLIGRYIDRKVR